MTRTTYDIMYLDLKAVMISPQKIIVAPLSEKEKIEYLTSLLEMSEDALIKELAKLALIHSYPFLYELLQILKIHGKKINEENILQRVYELKPKLLKSLF